MQASGKVALVTGASAGIGAACARALAARGARLAVTSRNADALQRALPEAFAVPGDLTVPADRGRIVESTLGRFGRIDILVNNAGAGLYVPAWQAPDEDARRLFELNFFAPLDLIRLTAPSMRRQGSGFIVNVASIAALVALPWMTLYSSSKFALASLTDGLRMELRRDGIRAMTVCPGYVDTGFQRSAIAGTPPPGVVRARRMAITAEACAAAIVAGIERNARMVVTPRSVWLLVAAARLFPRLVDARMERMLRQAS